MTQPRLGKVFLPDIAGQDIHTVARLLRHSGTKVTKRYYEFQTEPLKSAVEKVRRIR